MPAVPEAELDAAEARDVASVIGHLIDAGADQVLDGLDEAGWWEMWAEAPSAYAALYFATEGHRGVITPALAGFVLRLLGVADPAIDTGVLLGMGPTGLAGQRRAGGDVEVEGAVFAAPGATQLVCPVRSGPGIALARWPLPGALRFGEAGDEPPGRLRLAAGTSDLEPLVACDEHWDEAWRFARLAWSTQMLSMADEHLEAAREHCIEREQFGRPIASFQAVKHHLAQVKVAVEAARAVVRWAWNEGTEGAVLSAKALAVRAYLEAHNRGMHVMGGMGYSREHAIGRFHRVGLALEALGGTTRQCEEMLARLAISSPSALRSPEIAGPA